MQAPENTPRPSAAGPSHDKAALWAALSLVDSTLGEACGAWLALQLERAPQARALAVCARKAPERAPTLVASGPGGSTIDTGVVESLAAEALERRAPYVRSASGSAGGGFHVVVPLEAPDGWIVVAASDGPDAAALRALIDALRWGSGWLSSVVRRAQARAALLDTMRDATIDDVASTLRAAPDAGVATRLIVDALVAALPGARAAAAWRRADAWGPVSVSEEAEAARDDPVAVTAVERWLDAALAARAPVLSERQRAVATLDGAVPPPDDAVESSGEGRAIVALPLVDEVDAVVGALCVERVEAPFGESELELLRALAPRIAPILRDRPHVARATEVSWRRRAVAGLFGPVRLRAKLAFVAVLAGTLVLLGATDDYSVAVHGVVDGAAPRAVLAPVAGTLVEVQVRRGDAVRRNQVLGRIEEADVAGERARLMAERDALSAAGRSTAASSPDTGNAEAAVVAAGPSPAARLREIDQALRAIEERSARGRLISPVDGVITGGGALGAPGTLVDARAVLFEIAIDGDWRVRIDGDRRDLALLRDGQAGVLRIDGDASTLPIVVRRAGRDGAEAQLGGLSGGVRPEASGTVDIDVGQRKLAWIWWRALRSELRAWFPARDGPSNDGAETSRSVGHSPR
jgi:multidrug resistance efflux pump